MTAYSYDYMPKKWFEQRYHSNIFCRYADYVHNHNQ